MARNVKESDSNCAILRVGQFHAQNYLPKLLRECGITPIYLMET